MATFSILESFAKNWWVLLIRGILAVLFGIMAFTLPDLTAIFVGGSARAWWFVLLGVLGVIVGVFTFIYPGITAVALLYLIAAWAVVRGVFEIVTAIKLRKEISNEWLLVIAGVLSVLFGVALVANPAAGVLAVVWIIGTYAFIFGLMMIVLAFRLRGLSGRSEKFA
jgi:uncharacterized membrane protein HdeD (DUF308 family)